MPLEYHHRALPWASPSKAYQLQLSIVLFCQLLESLAAADVPLGHVAPFHLAFSCETESLQLHMFTFSIVGALLRCASCASCTAHF